MGEKPYLIDGVVGNGRMLAALGGNGRIYRLWWPRIDFPQHVREMVAGIHCPETAEGVLWLHSGDEWSHQQRYDGDTPVLITEAFHKRIKLRVVGEDFAVPGEDVLVRRYRITNGSDRTVPLRFLYVSSMEIAESPKYNTVAFDEGADALLHFRHRFAFALGGDRPCCGYQAGKAVEDAADGFLQGNRIAMEPEGALAWDLGRLAPGDTEELTLYLAAGEGRDAALSALERAKGSGFRVLREQTVAHWREYLESARPVFTGDEVVDRLYRRSLVVFKLMSDERDGGMIAAPEFDETFSRCGGYAYCWGRDAAYIATAIDRAGFSEMTRRFYRWTVKVQNSDGSWDQRHYLDGFLAPCWGMQIDETGSILWGMWRHFEETGDASFLEEVWEAVERGAEFLIRFLDPETGLPRPSRDLWEERDGEHTYSAAAVYGGLVGAAEIARARGRMDQAEAWQRAAEGIRGAISHRLWNPERKAFLRGLKRAVSREVYEAAAREGKKVVAETDSKGYVTYRVWEDPVIDASLLGLSVPFDLFPAGDERVVQTAAAVERCLSTSPAGGIKRYEDDPYIGGNPWIITTLWLAQYLVKAGRTEEALRWFRWAVDHRTSLDLLPEQVDRNTGKAAWVVPLTWSHAMFVLTVLDLMEAGAFNVNSRQAGS